LPPIKALDKFPSSTGIVAAGQNGSEATEQRGLRILIFGINYAPELAGIAPYTTGLAEHYASQGHEVEVITGIPHYPEWRPRAIDEPTGSNPRVRRYSHYVPRRASAFGRALYEITWLLSASRSLRRARADAVLGVIPSLSGGILASLAAQRTGAPFGLIFQDTMGAAARQSGYAGAERLATTIQSIEGSLCRRADRIGIVAEGFRGYLERRGATPIQIRRVRNWVRWSAPREVRSETRARLGWGPDEFIALHAGNMGKKQGLDNLLNAASELRTEAVRIVLAGGGNDRDRLALRAQGLGLQNVTFLDVQRSGSYESMLQAADVLIANQRASVGDMALPSKLTSYFASGRPVVAAVSESSETAHEVNSSKAGLVVDAEVPSKLAQAILSLRNDPLLAGALGESGRRYASLYLESEAALNQFDQLLIGLVDGEATERRALATIR
jgi:colanic acid biosynthesis glycosyl transferase WcaI